MRAPAQIQPTEEDLRALPAAGYLHELVDRCTIDDPFKEWEWD
ncbi:MAG TPA: hypothetical protein VG167_20960 [Verrucomicrobiae bacterium]|nr:hypothetical protein [Verrucomicrobiae bacterium]